MSVRAMRAKLSTLRMSRSIRLAAAITFFKYGKPSETFSPYSSMKISVKLWIERSAARMSCDKLTKRSGLAFPLKTFSSGEEATAGLKEALDNGVRILACFLDIKMPGMNGHDVLGWIRSQPALDRVPVIMLSSSDEAQDLRRAAKRGAQCFLKKHPSPEELRAVVEEAVAMTTGALGLDLFRCPNNRFRDPGL
jgi:CheY-like chemotaxis protein